MAVMLGNFPNGTEAVKRVLDIAPRTPSSANKEHLVQGELVDYHGLADITPAASTPKVRYYLPDFKP